MRIVENRGHELELRSSSRPRSVFWAVLALALALLTLLYTSGLNPQERDESHLIVPLLFAGVACLSLWRTRSLQVQLRREGPSGWTETRSFFRDSKRTFDTRQAAAVQVSTGRRFRPGVTSTASPAGSQVTASWFHILISSTVSVVFADGSSLTLGWSEGLSPGGRLMRREAQQVAEFLGVPLRRDETH